MTLEPTSAKRVATISPEAVTYERNVSRAVVEPTSTTSVSVARVRKMQMAPIVTARIRRTTTFLVEKKLRIDDYA
jgi:hypothetical protein